MAKKKLLEEIKPESTETELSVEVETVSPKYAWANKVRELFKRDPEVKLSFEQKPPVITIEVANQIKMLAIKELVGGVHEFNDGTVTVNVKLANQFGGDNYLTDVVYEAFKGNPLFNYIYQWNDPEATTNPLCWVAMVPEVIFYPTSDLHNVYGDSVALPEDLATAVLTPKTDHIFYCTSNPEREVPDHDVRFFN